MSRTRTVIRIILTAVIVLLLLFALLLAGLTFTEFRPEKEESLPVSGNAASSIKAGEIIRIGTWNTGYGALGDNADFFMDGGTMVQTADDDRVLENMDAIIENLHNLPADIWFLQESDRNSSRSCHIDEAAMIAQSFEDRSFTFAGNFRVPYVPYPVPPIGKVDSGLLTISPYPITESTRVSLPCPFSWPIRIANLKRCLMVDRVPIDGTDRELVLINLHLEAYDNGEGKVAQTRELLDVLNREAEQGNYVIAGGDFNQVFTNVDSSAYPIYPERWLPGSIDPDDFGSGWSLLMDPSVPTCRSLDQPYAGADPKTFQFYMIDGFIVSDNVTVESLETRQLNFENSDHNPVLMSFRLNA